MVAMFYCSDLNMVVNAQYCYSGIFSFTVMAIPFFMLAGSVISTGGIAKRIVEFASALVDFLTGALGCVSMLACMFFGALSGSGMATTAAIGGMMIPEMKKRGYDPSYAATLVCFGGTVGPIIPPSLSFVLYGATTKTSVPDLFKAGILPGIIIGLTFLVVNIIICKRTGTDLPVRSDEKKPLKEALVARLKRLGKATKDGFWALLSPVIILGGIYSGIVTPTEAACVSVFYALFVSLVVYRSITLKDLIPFLASSVKTYGGLAFVLAFATAFGRVLSLTRATKVIEDFIVGNFTTSWSVLSVLVILFLILGMVMDTGPAIVILAPILLPAVQALGVDSVHFGVILVCCLSIGLATPPFGLDLFVAGNLAEEPPMAVAKRAVPFIIAFLLALALITYVEPVSLALLGR